MAYLLHYKADKLYSVSIFFPQGCSKWIEHTLNEKLYYLAAITAVVAGIEVNSEHNVQTNHETQLVET